MLRTRIFLNLVPFVVILLAVGVYAVVLFTRMADSVDVTVMENYRSVVSAQTMSSALARMQSGVLLAFDDTNNFGEALFLQSRGLFETNLAVQMQSITLPGEAEMSRRLETNYQTFRAASAQFFAADNIQDRHRLYSLAFEPAFFGVSQLLDQVRELNHQAILATSESVQGLTQHMTRLMALGMLIALVIASYACWQLARSILRPIQAMTAATRVLGQGNLDQPVPVTSDDELGELATSFNTMAGQLQAYRQSTSEKILRLHHTMETTLASFPDPIFVLDREGRIELMNPSAESLAQACGLTDELPPRLQELAGRVLRTGEDYLPDNFKAVFPFRVGGKDKSFLPRILVMQGREDALLGVAVVLYDVTRFRLMDDAKTNLIATVSHELKTPLTSVRMVLHLLLERTIGGLTSKQHDLLITARDESERLLRILNDLLDLARLEEGNADLYRERMAPDELLRRIHDDLRDSVSSRGFPLVVSFADGLPAVLVDRQRIAHVFGNFITNAMKHSPAGAEIRLAALPGPDGSVKFSVFDRGPGVPEQYQARIFDRFFRVPGQTKPGAGLGLSIARQIVLAHGGHIGVRSQAGHGSEFYFVIDAAEALAPLAEVKAAAS